MLAIITCHFNFCGYKRPSQNLLRFLRQMKAISAPVFGVEAHLGNPATTGIHGWRQIQAGPGNVLWQKERLLNLAERMVPPEFDKIAWLDHDIFFENPRWLEITGKMLDVFPAVQPYSDAVWTGERGEAEYRKRSSASMQSSSRFSSHAGFAMAARRGLWRNGGLYEWCPIGTGDSVVMAALLGEAAERGPVGVGSSVSIFNEWHKRVSAWSGRNVGCVPGTVFHEWHGDTGSRNHHKKHAVVASLDVARDLMISGNGLVSWTPAASEDMKRGVAAHFEGRTEDGKPGRLQVSLAEAPRISVVVVTHDGYLPMLGRVLDSVDRAAPDQKILVVDGGDGLLPEREGWLSMGIHSRHPNPARNLGLSRVENGWVIFWDGDNIMPDDYVGAMRKAASIARPGDAVLYPDIKRVSERGDAISIMTAPEHDYWLLRERAYIDTSSCWRAAAVSGVGGFSGQQVKYDDYELALRLTASGWGCSRAGAAASLTSHPHHRGDNDRTQAMWTAHTFSLVTMWGSGCDPVPALEGILSLDAPPRASLVWSVDFRNTGLLDDLRSAEKLASQKFISARIMDSGPAWSPTSLGHRDLGRHQFVANLYNKVLHGISSDFVMLIEDDMIGPPGGIRKLLGHFRPGGRVASAAAAYRSRSNPSMLCASSDSKAWTSVPPESTGAVKCGMTGGGFTLLNNAMLRKALPMRCTASPSLLGWDANLGKTLNELGYQVVLDNEVQAEHRCKEVVEHMLASKNGGAQP